MKKNSQFDYIHNELEPLIYDMKLEKSLSFCVEKHLMIIEGLLDNGFRLSRLFDVICDNREYTINGFRTALQRARKKINNKNKLYELKNENTKSNINLKISKNENDKSNTCKNEKFIANNILDEDYSDWIDVLNLYKGYNIKALALVVPELIKAGWTKENYHILREHKEIMTINQLIKVVGIIESSQYRKNVFKDGKLCV